MSKGPESATEFGQILKRLSEPLPKETIKSRKGWKDKKTGQWNYVDYIEWMSVADMLDEVCPGWSHKVKNPTIVGEFFAVRAAITICGVTRMGLGTGDSLSEKGLKKAEHDALKRAAVKFGVGRDLYRDVNHEDDPSIDVPKPPKDPRAQGTGDMLSPRQMNAIKAICQAAQFDTDKATYAFFGGFVLVEELSKKAASAFIDWLKSSDATDEVDKNYKSPKVETVPPPQTKPKPVQTVPEPVEDMNAINVALGAHLGEVVKTALEQAPAHKEPFEWIKGKIAWVFVTNNPKFAIPEKLYCPNPEHEGEVMHRALDEQQRHIYRHDRLEKGTGAQATNLVHCTALILTRQQFDDAVDAAKRAKESGQAPLPGAAPPAEPPNGKSATPRQLAAIAAICKEKKLNQHSEVQALFKGKTNPEQLSTKQASEFIKHLSAVRV